jgi:hypothetical protein
MIESYDYMREELISLEFCKIMNLEYGINKLGEKYKNDIKNIKYYQVSSRYLY